MIEKVNADEKVKEGWLRLWLAFEILAAKADKGKDLLEDLMKRLEEDPRVKMYKKEFSETRRVEKPMPNVPEGFSMTCDVELIVANLDNATQIVMEFGPSAVEILEPNKVQVNIGEAQGILNLVSQMMHRFAAAGVGGIVVAGKKE